METRMLFQSFPDGRMLMGCVAIADQMQGFVLGCLAIDLAQKLQPFGVAMSCPFRMLNAANKMVLPLRLSPGRLHRTVSLPAGAAVVNGALLNLPVQHSGMSCPGYEFHVY